MSRDGTRSTTVWLQVKPSFGQSTYNRDDVQSIKIDKIFQKKPPRSAGTVIEVTVTVPEFIFKPLRPKLAVEIPADAVDMTPFVKLEIEGLKTILDDTT